VGIDYQCDRCRSRQPVQTGPVAYYTLPDGRCFFGPHVTGWCPRCRLLTEVEAVPSPEVVEPRLADLAPLPLDPAAGRQPEYLAALRDWSRTRREPPGCLRCGCQGFTPLREDGDHLVVRDPGAAHPFGHPGCGGVFRVVEVVFEQPVPRCLTADGVPVGHRWDGSVVRSLRRLICWASGRFN
jgi:hypothetical protein